MQIKKLSIIIPGLIDPVPYLDQIPVSELPELAVFSTLLSRGKCVSNVIDTSAGNYYNCLFNEFDDYLKTAEGSLSSAEGSQPPIASVSYLVDSLSDDTDSTGVAVVNNKWIMRADPCFMAPDRDQLKLVETKLELSLAESQQLADEINQFFHDFAQEKFWSLHAASADRWYIVSERPIRISSAPPEKVLLQSVKSFLFKGDDSQHWINLFNEFQMILHQSSINKKRIKQGRLPVNSVWFWGAGEAIDSPAKQQKEQTKQLVYSDNSVAKGLSLLHNYAYHDCPDRYQLTSQSASEVEQVTYIIDDFIRALQNKDVFTWLGLLQQFEKHYLVPILEEIKSGKIAAVELISPAGKKILLTKKLMRRWWKKIKPYHVLLAAK